MVLFHRTNALEMPEGFGAALLAMLMSGGGIYTDVGADLVGKSSRISPRTTSATPPTSRTTSVTARASPSTCSSPTRSCWSPR